MLANKLRALNRSIARLTRERNAVLAEVRRNCKHLRLVELEYRAGMIGTDPPMRICVSCGAEERGWGCGYQVLVTKNDASKTLKKEKRRARILFVTNDTAKFFRYRQKGPLYPVGQSHPNFAGGGVRTYEQLTEIAA